MGAWGKAPWDNDGATEWFDDVMDKSGLVLMVEAALSLDVEDHHEEVRAAAYVLTALGHVYIWPVHQLDAHLELAVHKLRQIAAMEIYAGAGFTPVIERETAGLESRIQRK